VIVGDANMSEVATYLKVGTTAIILAMIEDDALGDDLLLGNAVPAIRQVSHDPSLERTISAYVARSAPDGHTLFVGSNGPIMLGPMTMPKAPYQWDQAFAPVSSLAFATNMLLVRSSLPVTSGAELVAYARKNPGKLTLATSSAASINHFLGELLKLKSGATWTEVHYRGNAPAINALIGNHVDVGFQQLTDSLQQIQSGQLRALAVLGPKRVAALPNVPSIVEAGFPDVQGVTFNGVFAPKATPPAIVERLNVVIQAALKKQSVVEKLAALGSEARGSTPQEFTKFLQDESRKWIDVMKQANIKVSK
jgi:tripartite-type tricarboxylate transporter receptor subunit TctC